MSPAPSSCPPRCQKSVTSARPRSNNSRELYRLASGDNGISIAGANENGKIAKIPNYVGGKGHHRSEEHGSREIMGMEQNQTGRDVRPVGVTDRDHFLVLKSYRSEAALNRTPPGSRK